MNFLFVFIRTIRVRNFGSLRGKFLLHENTS
jgi:hypothetical protein